MTHSKVALMLIIFTKNNKAEHKLLNLKQIVAQHTAVANNANPANPALVEKNGGIPK